MDNVVYYRQSHGTPYEVRVALRGSHDRPNVVPRQVVEKNNKPDAANRSTIIIKTSASVRAASRIMVLQQVCAERTHARACACAAGIQSHLSQNKSSITT